MELILMEGEAKAGCGSAGAGKGDGSAQIDGGAVAGGVGERATPFSRVMKTWARWMSLVDHQHSSGWANPQDVKEFMACGAAVDVMIDNLPRIQWWAVRKAFGIATVWRFPEHSYERALEEAERTLSRAMQRNIATKRYFH